MKRLSQQEIAFLKSDKSPPERKSWIQQDVLKEWVSAGSRGTFEGATGVGKSRVAVLAMIRQFQKDPNSCVYLAVPTETLRDDDWVREMKLWGAEHLVDRVNRICWKSLGVEDAGREIDLFIGDEIHHITIMNSAFFNNNKVYDILSLTATLPAIDSIDTNDRDKRALIDALCPSFYKITLDEAVELELVADFEVKVILLPLDKYDLYIDPDGKNKSRTTEASHYMFLTKNLQKCMYKGRGNAKFIWIQRRMGLLYNLRSKEKLAREVLEKIHTPGKRTLVFCNSIEMSEKLCGENVYNSETDGSKLDAFQKKELDILGAVQALNEGKNVGDLDQCLIVNLNSKEKNAIQRIGRTIRFRPGHKGLVVVLVTENTADEKWFEEAFTNFDKSRIKKYRHKPKEAV